MKLTDLEKKTFKNLTNTDQHETLDSWPKRVVFGDRTSCRISKWRPGSQVWSWKWPDSRSDPNKVARFPKKVSTTRSFLKILFIFIFKSEKLTMASFIYWSIIKVEWYISSYSIGNWNFTKLLLAVYIHIWAWSCVKRLDHRANYSTTHSLTRSSFMLVDVKNLCSFCESSGPIRRTLAKTPAPLRTWNATMFGKIFKSIWYRKRDQRPRGSFVTWMSARRSLDALSLFQAASSNAFFKRNGEG